jgi:hypothetical protein
MRLVFLLTSALAALGLAGPANAQTQDPAAPLPTASTGLRGGVAEAPVTAAEAAQQVYSGLMALPGVRGVEAVADQPALLRLVAHNEVGIRLEPLLARLNATGANRAAEYQGFLNNVSGLLARTDPFKPAQLRVVIRTTAAIDAFEEQTAFGGTRNTVVRRAFASGLEEVVVGDTPTTIALMPVGRLKDLGLGATQAFDLGRANTQTELRNARWTAKDGLLEAQADTAYETSLLALDPVVRDLERRLGGPIAVAVPTRGRIVAGRADRPRDMSRLRAIMTAEAKGELKLASGVLVRRGGIWVSQ